LWSRPGPALRLRPQAAPSPPTAPALSHWPAAVTDAFIVNGDAIARGSFGEVYRAVDRATGADVVVKVMSKARPATKVRFFFFSVRAALPSPLVSRYTGSAPAKAAIRP
jgi:hypothetical protein